LNYKKQKLTYLGDSAGRRWRRSLILVPIESLYSTSCLWIH